MILGKSSQTRKNGDGLEQPSKSEQVAKRFHEVYERLAPQYGYKMRAESAVPWDELPFNHRALMAATVAEVLGSLHEPEQTPAPLGFDRAEVEGYARWALDAPVKDEEVSIAEVIANAFLSLLPAHDALRAKLVEADTNHAETYRKWTEEQARADALEQERDRLKEALERYGVHDATCDKVMAIELDPENNEEAPCSCGLLAALAAAGGEGASDA